MSTVKLSLASMTVPQKIQYARQVAEAMANHLGTFPSPPVDHHGMTILAKALESAYNLALTARQLAKERTTAQSQAEAAVDGALGADANYVQSVSAGDAALIESAGMSVKASATPGGLLGGPVGLGVEASAFAGELDLKWSPVKGKSSYVVQSTTTPDVPASWLPAAATTKAKASVGGLVSGTKYWFRVAAINASGTGAWSSAVGKMAP